MQRLHLGRGCEGAHQGANLSRQPCLRLCCQRAGWAPAFYRCWCNGRLVKWLIAQWVHQCQRAQAFHAQFVPPVRVGQLSRLVVLGLCMGHHW
jgi:hypothetical protein